VYRLKSIDQQTNKSRTSVIQTRQDQDNTGFHHRLTNAVNLLQHSKVALGLASLSQNHSTYQDHEQREWVVTPTVIGVIEICNWGQTDKHWSKASSPH